MMTADSRRATATGRARFAALLIATCLAGAGCHDEHWVTYPWDDRQVLCSQPFDDVARRPPWGMIERQMELAERTSSVLLMHAHVPGASVSVDTIEHVLKMADRHHLSFLTFRELEPGATPQAGIALAFDDSNIDSWFSLRDQLAAHRAHVSFFVTRWSALSEQERAELRTMADDGDDIQPHSVNHTHPEVYAAEHGVDAYVSDEVIPSIDALVDAGYPPGTVYAYPFGHTTDELNDAVLQVIPRVRVSPGSCPY